MKTALQQAIYLFVFIISIGSSAAYASCTELQGVTLCDNGDRKLVYDDVTYISSKGELTIASTMTDSFDLYGNGYYRVRCYRQGGLHDLAHHCYSVKSYHGDRAGH